MALVGLVVVVACSVTSPATAPGGTAIWGGLTYEPEVWEVGADETGDLLTNQLDPGCTLRLIKGGSDLRPGWSADSFILILGPNSFAVFEVASPDGPEYVNYFYQSGDLTLNSGGFQLTLPASEVEACSESAEELLATLDPQGLVVPTSTASG